MHLRRIEVRDFRKIAHRVVEGLGDGLNVIVGDNEAGKSTLLAALRTVFFERYSVSGKPIELMLPYNSNVRPEILVTFEVAGTTWQLRKAFNQRPEAELSGGGERYSGTAVEERLVELLGFTPPGRGGAKAEEHHGTHGLLWVEQGTRASLGVGAGRDTLAGALEREVGQVTGGDRGRALLAAAELRRNEFWTKTDKPRGDIKELRDGIERLEGERAALLARQEAHHAKIRRLTDIGEILARHARDDRLAKAASAVIASRQAVAAAEALDGALQRATALRRDAERERELAAERCTRRAAQVANVGAARLAAEAAAGDLAEARTVAQHRDTQAKGAALRLAEARQALRTAETQVRALDGALVRHRAEAALARQRAQVEIAEAQDKARRDAVARGQAWSLDREGVAALARLEKLAEAARAELRAASVQVGFAATVARTVLVDGVAHPADETLVLTQDAVLALEGFGTLTIRPGGGTGDLARRAAEAERAATAALATLGVASLADARLGLEHKAAAEAEAASLTRSVLALAPKGLDALRQGLQTEVARLARLPVDDGPTVGPGEAPALLDGAHQAEALRRTAVAAAEADDASAGAARQAADLEVARLGERVAAVRQTLESLAADLAQQRRTVDDDRLDHRLQTATDALATAAAAEALARTVLDAADLDAARLVQERSETAERVIRTEAETLERDRRDIVAELRGGGDEGLSERLGVIDDVLATSRKRLAGKELEAAASRLLYDTLFEAQRDAKDRWLNPVRRRVSPYLKLMEPGAEIEMDEHTLEIKGFRRNGVTEPFASLSMGAREQVAVMTRLALADVLRDAGHPAVVILDDSLVNTDETRLDRMHNVLTLAAKSLQILVLTCREREYVGLGALHRM